MELLEKEKKESESWFNKFIYKLNMDDNWGYKWAYRHVYHFPWISIAPFFYSYKLQSHMAGCEVKKEEEESGCLIQKW